MSLLNVFVFRVLVTITTTFCEHQPIRSSQLPEATTWDPDAVCLVWAASKYSSPTLCNFPMPALAAMSSLIYNRPVLVYAATTTTELVSSLLAGHHALRMSVPGRGNA